MTERFAVLLRFNEIRDNTTLTLFLASLALLLGWGFLSWSASAWCAYRKEQASEIYISLCLGMWLVWMIVLFYAGRMP